MASYRINANGHLIPVSKSMGDECEEWISRQDGNKYIFTCKSNPSLEKVYSADEVDIFE
ncbi:MAG: hypothetical protein QXL94_00440 [Candidatus Parvarchaeum sp.]